MSGTKPWYLSKTILGALLSALVTLYFVVEQFIVPGLPSIPDAIFSILNAIGISVTIYGRTVASTSLGK